MPPHMVTALDTLLAYVVLTVLIAVLALLMACLIRHGEAFDISPAEEQPAEAEPAAQVRAGREPVPAIALVSADTWQAWEQQLAAPEPGVGR